MKQVRLVLVSFPENQAHMKIAVVVGTIRRGRQSIKVGNYLIEELNKREGVEAALVDLEELDVPMLWERRHWMEEDEIPAGLTRYKEQIDWADGVVLVAPEYNGGYPAVLKNVLDALYSEYKWKPFGLCCVSAGYGGYTVISQLREVINRFQGIVVPATFMARNASKSFDEEGNMISEHYPRSANKMLDDLIWLAEAINRQKERTES